MTAKAKEIQKRDAKAQTLRVVYVDGDLFFVESEKGKICYRVMFGDTISCTCGDFVKNGKNDPDFKCKHILAVDGAIRNGDVHEGRVVKKAKPQLNEEFISNIKGKDFVLYAGLLDLGHQKGIRSIIVEALQYPTKENGMVAICRASLESKLGEEYTEIGDANPGNVNKMVAGHILRLAATRAKARCLRDYTNVGITCLEEIGDINDVLGDEKPAKKAASKKAPAKKATSKKKTEAKSVETAESKKPEKSGKEKVSADDNENDAPKMSEAQQRAIMNLSRRRGISTAKVENMAMESYNTPLENLSASDASTFIRQLQQAA